MTLETANRLSLLSAASVLRRVRLTLFRSTAPPTFRDTDTPSLTKAVSEALASGKPALINAVIDPTAGTESGHIQSLNPRSAAAQRPPP